MSINARLDTLVPNLTARQRAMMVLRALASGQDPDPALHAIRDDRERRVFNRYMALLYVVNVEMDGMLHSVFHSVESIEGQTTLELLREAGAMVEEQTGEKPDPRVVKTWRRAPTVNVTEVFLGIAEEVRALLLADTLARWRELQSLEAVWDDLALEFDGESLLLPEVREKVEQTRARLGEQLQRLGGPRRLPGPDEATTQLIHDRVERAFDHLGLVDPVPTEAPAASFGAGSGRW